MSYQLLKADVLFYQRFLKANGFYKNILDGEWGKNTNKADTAFVAKSASIAQQFGTFDSRSEANIISLVPKAQIQARRFLKTARDNNKDVRILSGTRTYAEQDTLYGQGRNGRPGPKVTNAKGGQSNHNFGIAWDIGLFDKKGSYITNDAEYKLFADIILPAMSTLEWGGNWKTFKDFPHYQLIALSEDVATIRDLFENGNVYV